LAVAAGVAADAAMAVLSTGGFTPSAAALTLLPVWARAAADALEPGPDRIAPSSPPGRVLGLLFAASAWLCAASLGVAVLARAACKATRGAAPARDAALWLVSAALVCSCAAAGISLSMGRSWHDPCGPPSAPLPLVGRWSLLVRAGLLQPPGGPVLLADGRCGAAAAANEAAGWARHPEAVAATVLVVAWSVVGHASEAVEAGVAASSGIAQAAVGGVLSLALFSASHACMLTSGCLPAVVVSGSVTSPHLGAPVVVTAHHAMLALALLAVGVAGVVALAAERFLEPSPARSVGVAMMRAACAAAAQALLVALVCTSAWKGFASSWVSLLAESGVTHLALAAALVLHASGAAALRTVVGPFDDHWKSG